MSLPNGASEIDTVVVRLPDEGREITNWSSYQFDQQFLTPTAGWSFRLSDEDTELTRELLVPGARVELVCNGRVQCTGTIDRRIIEGDASAGTSVTIKGRDILGRVVDATMDPRWKFAPGMTVPDVVLGVLRPFGITTVYNSDVFNINVVTGYGGIEGKPKGGSGGAVKVKVPRRVVKSDDTVSLEYDTVDGFVQTSNTRPDLKTIQIEQVKPHAGEGVFAYLERILRRLGLTLWAMADGSGVVIDRPDFSGPAKHTIVHRRDKRRVENNVLHGSVEVDLVSQPSCVVAFGFGGGRDTEKSALKIIAVNELVGLDEDGEPLEEIQKIAARYKSAKLLPVRRELAPLRRPKGDRKIVAPFFVKDDESKSLAQLEAFARRELANHQQKALTANYDVLGHTQSGAPFGVNTLVLVDDDVRDVHEELWVQGKTFTKSSNGGTRANLRLIRPHTLRIGA